MANHCLVLDAVDSTKTFANVGGAHMFWAYKLQGGDFVIVPKHYSDAWALRRLKSSEIRPFVEKLVQAIDK